MLEDYTIVKNAILVYLMIILLLFFLKPDIFNDTDKKRKAYIIAFVVSFFSFYFTLYQYV